MNDQNVKPQEQRKIEGWKDVNITMDTPMGSIIYFINLLNQRLATVEDEVVVMGPNGKHISLTDLYAAQAQAQEEAEKAQAQAQNKESEQQ